MKKLIAVLLASLLLTGCSTSNSTPTTTDGTTTTATTVTDDSTLAAIKKSGVLKVSVSPDYPPMEFMDADNNPIGSDISLAQYIADKLGVELQIETMDFSATLTAVDLDKVDMGISGFGWTEEREAQYELSTEYNTDAESESGCNGIMVLSSNVDDYQTLEDFAGKTVAAQANSIQEEITLGQTTANVEKIATLDVGILELQTGKIDGLTLSCTVAEGYANSLDNLALASPRFTVDEHLGNVVVVKKGQTDLIAAVNEIMDEVNSKELYQQWYEDAKVQATAIGIDFE